MLSRHEALNTHHGRPLCDAGDAEKRERALLELRARRSIFRCR